MNLEHAAIDQSLLEKLQTFIARIIGIAGTLAK